MPANLNYELYFNIVFFSVIGLGFFIGYFRGLKKTLYALVVTLVFYAFFFLTIDVVINQLWDLPIPFVFGYVTGFLPELANAQTIGEAVFTMVETFAGDQLGDSLSNEVLISFVTGLSQFVLKLVYMIVYFTLGQLIFKFIARMFRIIFFGDKDKKEIRAQADKMVAQKLDLAKAEQAEKDLKKRLKKMKPKERKAYYKQQKLDKKLLSKKKKEKVKKLSRKQKRVMAIQVKKDAKLEKKRVRKLRGKEKRAYIKEQKMQKKLKAKYVKKIKRDLKKPLFGALVGGAKGALSAFVMMILLGGMLNISESFLALLPEENPTPTVNIEEILYLQRGFGEFEMVEVTPVSPLIDIPSDLEEYVQQGRDAVNAYNENVFVVQASKLVLVDDNYEEAIPLNLYLFDSVLSFTFSDNKVLLREELSTLAETAQIILESEYVDTRDLSDLKGTEIAGLFNALSKSELITSMIPLAIEVGSDYFDTPVEVPIEDLYAIDWQSELSSLGAVASIGFDLINTAGILNDETDLQTVTLDGEDVSGLFDSLADSELVTLAAYVAVEPLLETMSGSLSAIITVPEDLQWDEEFRAFGQVAEAVLNTNITVGDLQEADPTLLISALAEMDFTVLLDSQIVSHALKNIFSGDAGIDGLDMIVVPVGIVWFDVYDDAGNLVTTGELRNILLAVNSISKVADGFDFENISFDVIADFDDDAIDSLFGSDILVASISDFLLNMDLGDTPLLIPDSVLDDNGYILSSELKAVASSARVLVEDLSCDEGDTACEEQGFDIAKAFGLSTASIDTLTTSDILGATIGNLIIENGGEFLTIPPSALSVIEVDTVAQEVVSKSEISNLFQAVSVLGFTDLDNMAFDASIISGLETEVDSGILDTTKSDKLFGSKLVHATLSQMLFEQTEGVDSVLTVPYLSEDLVEIREFSVADDLEYLSTDELENILQALLTLDISDFTAVDSLDLNKVIADSDTLLNSSILHATISKQVFDLGSDVISVPYKDIDGNLVRITVGDSLDSTDTEYIKTTEIISILDALEILEINDFGSFDGTVDLAKITSNPLNVEKMLLSATLHATISEQLVGLDTDGTITIPFLEEDNSTPVRETVGDVGFETEYVTKDEIESMIDALNVLGIVDVESFSGSVDLSLLMVDDNIDIVLTSSTIQATISDQLIGLDTDGTITLPFFEEDGLTPIRFTVGTTGTETEYVLRSEITAMIDAMDILGFTDVEAFSGSVDLSLLMVDNNIDVVLTSSTIQATISDQLVGLDTNGTITLPYFEEDGLTEIRFTVGTGLTETEYVLKSEITAMIDAMDILGFTDVEAFSGTVSLEPLMVGTNKDIVLLSSTIQATISSQLIDLDTNETINLPYFKEDDSTEVRILVGTGVTETEYVLKSEIATMIDALDILGITDVESFTGDVDLSILAVDGNAATILSSSMIQATVSDQVLELSTDPGLTATFVVPFLEEDDATIVRVTVGDALEFTDTEYIKADELEAMINGLNILGITDVSTFSGNIDLTLFYVEENRDILLTSAIMQATISTQLIELGNSTLVIPDEDIAAVDIKLVVGTGLTETAYVSKTEISAMFEALEVLGIADINSFTGTIDLNNVYGDTNQDIILSSASMHATITKQMVDLGQAVLYIPDTDVSNVSIRQTVSGTEFLEKVEIKSMINGLEVLGITDITSFSGSFSLASLSTDAAQNILLSSASIHATITNTLVDLDDAVLIVPMYTQAGETSGNEIRLTVGSFEFVVKDEVKALINAFTSMGYTDLDSFGASIDSSQFFTGRATLLQSASIQATLSSKMINDTGGELVVPNININNLEAIRLEQTDVVYIEINEMNAILDALDELGLTNFASMSFSPATIFSVDFDLLLTSASIQATISSNILDSALDETAPVPSTTIIVPTFFREDIVVGLVPGKQIEKVELKALLGALDELGLTDFGGSFNASTITSMDDTQLDKMLLSGSVHTTIDNMLRGNSNINTQIPALAITNAAYKSNIITTTEVKAFIKATQVITTGGSFTTVNFDLAAIAALTPTEQGIAADSMIVRNILTPQLETISANPFDTYPLVNADYEENDPLTFLTKTTVLAIIAYYY